MPTLISTFTKRCSLVFSKNHDNTDVLVPPAPVEEPHAPKASFHSHTIHTDKGIDHSITTQGDTGGFPATTNTTTEAKSKRRSVLATFGNRSSTLFKRDALPLFEIFNGKLPASKQDPNDQTTSSHCTASSHSQKAYTIGDEPLTATNPAPPDPYSPGDGDKTLVQELEGEKRNSTSTEGKESSDSCTDETDSDSEDLLVLPESASYQWPNHKMATHDIRGASDQPNPWFAHSSLGSDQTSSTINQILQESDSKASQLDECRYLEQHDANELPESKSTMSILSGEMTPADFDVAFQEVFGIRQGVQISKRSSRTTRRPD
ncbi:395_t:CDS:2 [Acaulospora colombiana]|uniref:395_t:CDS:1 n=1 Tax=Acaulospora colombiana TaxID=27376 RepID=A0ACA9NIN3_9GLOM|nr:395_t:CDS:2 [Acaulospora colombiana]